MQHENENPRPVPTAVPDDSADRSLFVAVAAEGDIFDTALCALVEKLGHHTGIVRLDADDSAVPRAAGGAGAEDSGADGSGAGGAGTVILVRSAHRLRQIRQNPRFQNAVLLGVGVRAGDPRGLDIPDTVCAATELAAFLAGVADRLPYRSARVRLTERERQILTTYALGTTMAETARRHHIAESTVREHYRRVTQRYADAGRPIGNKAQLLLRLMSDGWVRPLEILQATA
ncbi:LuxR C-terminal-related transcriptional regulator [Gordonia sp. DT219]|uniref:helix-turn-helix transcriptional regulator n=1 Tax=Gordonia sp. DT219 TaxID=3416658 RepID=UPI003CEFF3C8